MSILPTKSIVFCVDSQEEWLRVQRVLDELKVRYSKSYKSDYKFSLNKAYRLLEQRTNDLQVLYDELSQYIYWRETETEIRSIPSEYWMISGEELLSILSIAANPVSVNVEHLL